MSVEGAQRCAPSRVAHMQEVWMNRVVPMVLGALVLSVPGALLSQTTSSARAPRTLVGVLAHADDEAPVAPILARYAREGEDSSGCGSLGSELRSSAGDRRRSTKDARCHPRQSP